jgi:hypothetical protein
MNLANFRLRYPATALFASITVCLSGCYTVVAQPLHSAMFGESLGDQMSAGELDRFRSYSCDRLSAEIREIQKPIDANAGVPEFLDSLRVSLGKANQARAEKNCSAGLTVVQQKGGTQPAQPATKTAAHADRSNPLWRTLPKGYDSMVATFAAKNDCPTLAEMLRLYRGMAVDASKAADFRAESVIEGNAAELALEVKGCKS